MMQIVHDIAPKSKLAFRTGFISAGDLAVGIRELKQNNCDIIVDDVTYITEPFHSDGVVAQAVNEVTAQGVAYFTSAGNFADKSYQANFSGTTAPPGMTGQAHNFGGGDIYQSVTLKPGVYTIVLQWQDAFYSLGQAGTQNDFDIYLTNDNGATLYGFNRNNMGADPLEILPITVTANTQTNILIVRAEGSGAANIKYVMYRGDATINEFKTGTSTIVGHANASGAITIGAVRYSQSPAFGTPVPVLESFSSFGGMLINNVASQKPDFTAPDGINTSVNFGAPDIENDQISNFFGTSAAAPHAAAVAALIVQARKRYYNENFNGAQLRQLFQQTALDMREPGFDFGSGYGFIRSDLAIQEMAAATPSLIRLVVPTGVTPGSVPFNVTVKANYLSTDTKILFRGIEVPTTFLNDSTALAAIPAFTG
jgi:subtilisin family serine protease